MGEARRTFAAILNALLVVAMAACGTATRTPSATTTPSAAGPGATVAPTATAAPVEPADLRVYFFRGDKVDVAHRSVPATQSVATAAMTQMLAGPTPADQASGLSSAIPAATRLLGINMTENTATVDLSGDFASGGGSLSMAARLAQVTYTLTQFPSVTQVAFRLDGKPVTVFGGEGIVLDHPSTRASFETLTPPILAEFPGRGWTVQSPIHVGGTANVFEAQFRVELTDAAGHVIASQPVHATAGTGTRGTFDATVAYTLAAGGTGTLTLFDNSPKDGSRIDVVQIPLQLSASPG
jgi:spore germination protein GerM